MIGKLAAFAVVALVGAGISGGASAAGTHPSGAGVATAAVREIDTLEAHKVQHTIDNGQPGFGAGDVITVSSRLTTHDGATRLGVSHEVCTAVRTNVFALECSATIELSDGQISVQGEFPPSDPQTSYAVTGGTGAYDSAGGRMRITSAPDHELYLDFFLTG
jgi:hypothetical protein